MTVRVFSASLEMTTPVAFLGVPADYVPFFAATFAISVVNS
jgi:hypothetical protein